MAKPQPTLLGIPPELRNRIYTATLVDDESINIYKIFNRKQPGLLSVCRRIRKEAIGIYYNENDFHFEACKSSGADVYPFTLLQKKYRSDHKVKLPTFICHHRDYFDEDAQRAWLKVYHKDADAPCPAQDAEYERRESKNIAIRMFGIVDNMRKKPWKRVNKVLDVFFYSVRLLEMDRHPMDWEEEEFGFDDEWDEYEGDSDEDEDEEDNEDDDASHFSF